jgi:hypothetical protein
MERPQLGLEHCEIIGLMTVNVPPLRPNTVSAVYRRNLHSAHRQVRAACNIAARISKCEVENAWHATPGLTTMFQSQS